MSVGQIRIMERWGTLFEPWGAATGHILWPFWPKIAIFGHRHSQQPQMGWTLVEQGWTLYFTSGGFSLDPFCPPKVALGGPRTPQNDPFRSNMAIVAHRQSQQPQIGWRLVGHSRTYNFTSRGVGYNHLEHPEMSFLGPKSAQKRPFLTQYCHIWP